MKTITSTEFIRLLASEENQINGFKVVSDLHIDITSIFFSNIITNCSFDENVRISTSEKLENSNPNVTLCFNNCEFGSIIIDNSDFERLQFSEINVKETFSIQGCKILNFKFIRSNIECSDLAIRHNKFIYSFEISQLVAAKSKFDLRGNIFSDVNEKHTSATRMTNCHFFILM